MGTKYYRAFVPSVLRQRLGKYLLRSVWDLVGGFVPDERSGVFVPLGDPLVEVGGEFGDGSVGRALAASCG